jgi:hypothetical protein
MREKVQEQILSGRGVVRAEDITSVREIGRITRLDEYEGCLRKETGV